MRRRLPGWAAVLLPALLVACAAATAIALNVLLLEYASASAADPVGRFRPQLRQQDSTTQVLDKADVEKRPASTKKRVAKQSHASAQSSPSPAPASTAAESAGESESEPQPEPGETDDD